MVRYNPTQERAITSPDGKTLVLAGAGSGKTSVIIGRLAHLTNNLDVDPKNILGLTFTNKAAEEMRERIAKRIGKKKAEKIILSTFHSFCNAILKTDIHHIGYTRQFSIYDERDVTRLLKNVESHLAEECTEEKPEIDEEKLNQELKRSMKAYNAVDFDGLLSLTLELFKEHPEVLAKYQERFRYILIDEYQDTNEVQYELASLLSAKHGNLFVVGDDDQSIYSWRGAKVENILNFPYDTVIKLEQNYRSTQTILDTANAVIARNSARHEKNLFSVKKDADKPRVFHAPDETEEAQAVVDRLVRLKTEHKLSWSDFAILYRSNNLSRPFEAALLSAHYREEGQFKRGVPYHIIQGTEFTERAEIKDLVAYLKVISNPKDQNAILRIINYPRRGISPTTTEQIRKKVKETKQSFFDLLENPESLGITSQGERGVEIFHNLITKGQELFDTLPLKEAMEKFVEQLDLKKVIHDEVQSDKARQFKWANIQTLIKMTENVDEKAPLGDFLSEMMLDSNRPGKNEKKRDSVNLLTFHSAKGLEFTACFLVGLEEKIMPHERSLAEGGLEEERRLFYVALTRAKKYLTLSMAKSRTSYGKKNATNPSRFLFELPKEGYDIEHYDKIIPFLH